MNHSPHLKTIFLSFELLCCTGKRWCITLSSSMFVICINKDKQHLAIDRKIVFVLCFLSSLFKKCLNCSNLILAYITDCLWHMQKKGSFQCDRCKKHYTYKRNLDRHVKYECGIMPQFQCPFCSKRSKLKTNLHKHMAICHKVNFSGN